MKDFGTIVRAEAMAVPHLVSFIDFTEMFVNMEKKDNESGLRRKKYGVLAVMPELMVDFAERSRAHDGYRLLKRAARHATDPATAKFSGA
jgi:hypothetical protein